MTVPIVAIVGGLMLAAFTLEQLDAPYVWIAGIAASVCALRAFAPPISRRRVLWFNVGIAIVVLGGIELYMQLRDRPHEEGTIKEDYHDEDDFLGYRPIPGVRATAIRYFGDELLYDVSYTIDELGLRAPPPEQPSEDPECILFFGGSFTFGEGVADHETMPYRVGVETGGHYRIHNFGFHGYGPHQMLSAMVNGVVESTLTCRPRYVIYQGIDWHIRRAAGLVFWDEHGPRFELQEDGRVAYQGSFDDGARPWPEPVVERLKKSRALLELSRWRPKDDEDDYARYIGILETTRGWVEHRYPESEFHVLLWDKPGKALAGDLIARGFRLHRVSEILPDREDNSELYEVHPRDGHPSAFAHSQIAKALVARLNLDTDGP